MEKNTDLTNKTVLLVDDDAVYRGVVAFDFKRKGFRVLHAGTGNEAWAVMQAENVHLVITDVQMPDGNGMELLNRIRERDLSHPPVILVTGHTSLNLSGAREWGAEAVFLKPFDRKVLIAASQAAVMVGKAKNGGVI